MTDTEVLAEGELREWPTAHNITAKIVNLLVKDGFSSMDAIELLDKEDLAQSKIPRGQQKLLLKALQPRQACGVEDEADGGSHRDDGGGGATGQNQLAGEAKREVYTQLMREHFRTIQGTTATTPTPHPGASHKASHFEHCATMSGLWQDPLGIVGNW